MFSGSLEENSRGTRRGWLTVLQTTCGFCFPKIRHDQKSFFTTNMSGSPTIYDSMWAGIDQGQYFPLKNSPETWTFPPKINQTKFPPSSKLHDAGQFTIIPKPEWSGHLGRFPNVWRSLRSKFIFAKKKGLDFWCGVSLCERSQGRFMILEKFSRNRSMTTLWPFTWWECVTNYGSRNSGCIRQGL